MGDTDSFERLVAIMDRLRGPEGCPWDREQDYRSLRGFLLEECYEVAEALDDGDEEALREELGDLLFQIVFLSRIGKERGTFTIDDVVGGIADKMIRRHPHVFGAATAETSDDVLKHWEAIKRREKGDRPAGSLLDGIPRALPELPKAQRLGTKAARVGFDWKRPLDVLDKIDEEIGELRAAVHAGDARASGEELGDALFSLAMLARHLGIEAEAALAGSNAKFRRRFQWIERELAAEGASVEDTPVTRLDQLWERAKNDA